MWEGILDRIDNGQMSRSTRVVALWTEFKRYGYYAAAALVLGVSVWWLVSIREAGRIPRTYEMQVSQQSTELIEYKNLTGKVERLTLPDGSVLLLSKGSKVSYEKSFSGADRKVYLSGEGDFQVVKNPGKPFLVFADNLVTQVVGTHFTVDNTQPTGDISVAVQSGKVKVFMIDAYHHAKAGKKLEVLLTANQEAKFSASKWQLTKSISSKPAVIRASEKYPDFNFEKTAIVDVFTTLEDSYGVEIAYDHKMIADCNLTAELGDESLFKKLDIICRTIDATYEVFGTEIVVKAKGCSR